MRELNFKVEGLSFDKLIYENGSEKVSIDNVKIRNLEGRSLKDILNAAKESVANKHTEALANTKVEAKGEVKNVKAALDKTFGLTLKDLKKFKLSQKERVEIFKNLINGYNNGKINADFPELKEKSLLDILPDIYNSALYLGKKYKEVLSDDTVEDLFQVGFLAASMSWDDWKADYGKDHKSSSSFYWFVMPRVRDAQTVEIQKFKKTKSFSSLTAEKKFARDFKVVVDLEYDFIKRNGSVPTDAELKEYIFKKTERMISLNDINLARLDSDKLADYTNENFYQASENNNAVNEDRKKILDKFNNVWDILKKNLSKKELYILQKHYLEGTTLVDLAKHFGLTKQRLQQLKEEALKKARLILKENEA